jgi:ubiquinone biosynthesis protein UbiJ|tara:strand:- start:646 stop:792 length:147 start_codon:yes stop_codon:yes gene_type:complete
MEQQERYYKSMMEMNKLANKEDDLRSAVEDLKNRVKNLEEEIAWQKKD